MNDNGLKIEKKSPQNRFIVVFKGGYKHFQGINAWVVMDENYDVVAEGQEMTPKTKGNIVTANREYLKALSSALGHIPFGSIVAIISDSEYAFSTIVGRPVKNLDLVRVIEERMSGKEYRLIYHDFYQPVTEEWRPIIAPFLHRFNSVAGLVGWTIG